MTILAILSLLLYFSAVNKKNNEIAKLTEEIKKSHEEKLNTERVYQEKMSDLKRDLELQRRQNTEEVKMLYGKINILDDKFNTFVKKFNASEQFDSSDILDKLDKKIDSILKSINTLVLRNTTGIQRPLPPVGHSIDKSLQKVESALKQPEKTMTTPTVQQPPSPPPLSQSPSSSPTPMSQPQPPLLSVTPPPLPNPPSPNPPPIAEHEKTE
jgi:hypothetical protein